MTTTFPTPTADCQLIINIRTLRQLTLHKKKNNDASCKQNANNFVNTSPDTITTRYHRITNIYQNNEYE